MTLVILAHFFVVRTLLGMKKSPLLTLNQTVLLLATILPRPEFDAQAALDWIQYRNQLSGQSPGRENFTSQPPPGASQSARIKTSL